MLPCAARSCSSKYDTSLLVFTGKMSWAEGILPRTRRAVRILYSVRATLQEASLGVQASAVTSAPKTLSSPGSASTFPCVGCRHFGGTWPSS
eukprot:13497782-Heterocapsa_arctica.AAC.1